MSFKKKLRNFRLSVGKSLLDKEFHHHSKTERILFMRQDGKLGDYMVSSFCYREIKKFNPTIHIGVVCTRKDAYLYESNPYIDALYFVRTKHIADYISMGRRLAKLNYDVVIDPTETLRNRDLLFLRLINAAYYIGYQKSDYKMFNASIEGVQHYSSIYIKALQKLGIATKNTNYDIPFNATAEKDVEAFLQQHAIRDYIAINFYGAARARTMSVENIKKHIAYIQQQKPNRAIVLLSYPAVYDELKAVSDLYGGVYVHRSDTIFHTIALIRHCLQLISIDTSTIHIASSFNKKIIAWYRTEESNYKQWHPISDDETHVVFYHDTVNELNPEQIKSHWLV